MINELYQLSQALDKFNINSTTWHREYLPLPNVTAVSPCFRIIIKDKHVHSIESLSSDIVAKIRKFGSNQGTFPAMNLSPLYRISAMQSKEVDTILKKGYASDNLPFFRSLCQKSNWSSKAQARYNNCVINVPKKIRILFQNGNVQYQPFDTIAEEFLFLQDFSLLHKELTEKAFDLLAENKDCALAAALLFYSETDNEESDKDNKNLSVVFDSAELIQLLRPVISEHFTAEFNRCLLLADQSAKASQEHTAIDAFGYSFAPLNDKMPKVKLAAGFEATLRTMFEGQPCQHRYGRIENATYPVSPEIRMKLQSALSWIGSKEHDGITWLRTAKDEALFAYPEIPNSNSVNYVSIFRKRSNAAANSASFEAASQKFISEIMKGKEPGSEPKSSRIQLLVLRKIDKARTKVVYTYNTTPSEIEHQAEAWSLGCMNLPDFPFGTPETLYPLDIAKILNRFWKQDGSIATDRFQPVPAFRGLSLLFEPNSYAHELAILSHNVSTLAPSLQSVFWERQNHLLQPVKESIALLGLLLSKANIQKEIYMKDFPYQLGQLLKVSDALHEMYCRIVRDGDIPTQFVGSSFYISAMEQPYRTIAQLGQRMNPYITWARTYRCKGTSDSIPGSRMVGWYLSLYEKTAGLLLANWDGQTRFNDEEKAQLFLGYLAAFPKKEVTELNNNGGNDHE